jgi:GMP synthase-like glutamine amidotransferase
MRIHSLEHEPFEGLANIEVWAKNRGHSISRTLLLNNEEFPYTDDFDWLIIMGGSMNVYEYEKYPWLIPEKKFIADAIAKKKIVLGVCLGSQLIADVLGGKISKNRYKEIGWFPVSLTEHGKKSPIFNNFPKNFITIHWHGDTFSIPEGATWIAKSQACENQAFEYDDGRVVGLQFHLEYSKNSIDLMFLNCLDDMTEGKYIQKPGEILKNITNVQETTRLLNLLLDNMARKFRIE